VNIPAKGEKFQRDHYREYKSVTYPPRLHSY
jgi:hypothetical protein